MARERLCHLNRSYCAPNLFSDTTDKDMNPAQKLRAGELRRLLKEIDGLDITLVNNRLVVDGICSTRQDYERVQSVVALYKSDDVANLTRVSPRLPSNVAQAICNDVNLPEVEARNIGQTIVLQGTVDSKAEFDRVNVIAENYAKPSLKDGAVLNLIEIRAPARSPAYTVR
jgi:hypothetical protein